MGMYPFSIYLYTILQCKWMFAMPRWVSVPPLHLNPPPRTQQCVTFSHNLYVFRTELAAIKIYDALLMLLCYCDTTSVVTVPPYYIIIILAFLKNTTLKLSVCFCCLVCWLFRVIVLPITIKCKCVYVFRHYKHIIIL